MNKANIHLGNKFYRVYSDETSFVDSITLKNYLCVLLLSMHILSTSFAHIKYLKAAHVVYSVNIASA